MSTAHLKSMFERLANRLGAEIRRHPEHPAVRHIELQAEHAAPVQARLGIDGANAMALVETVFPFPAVLAPERLTLENLLALHVAASLFQSGIRFFPTLDMHGERFIVSYLVGSETIRSETDLASLVRSCSAEAVRLVEDARKVDPTTPSGARRPACGSGRRLRTG